MKLEEQIKKFKGQNIYAYCILNFIEYKIEGPDKNNFSTWIDIFNKPNEIIKALNKEKGRSFTKMEIELGLNEKEIGIKFIKEPKALKYFLKVDDNKLPDQEENLEIRLIRKQLMDYNRGCIEINNTKYYVIINKGDLFSNYYLYNAEEYFNFIECMSNELKGRYKEINDKEYIRLIIELNRWKRKEENIQSKKIIEYLNEIKGKFDIWYLESNFNPPTLVSIILHLRKKVVDFTSKILEIKTEIKDLNAEKKQLEIEFDKDITEFPLDLKEKFEKNNLNIEKRKKSINEIEKVLWGTFDKTEEGLIWNHDKLLLEYKKINLDDDALFEELFDKSTGEGLEKLKNRIKNILTENRIDVTYNDLNDLSLEVLNIRLSNDDQFYEEMVNEEKTEENLTAVIYKVLNCKYQINMDPIQSNKKIFDEQWGKIVNSFFNNEIIIKIIDDIGDEKEDEFIEYMRKMFKRRTIKEWIKYYEFIDKGEIIKNFRNSKLSDFESYNNYSKAINFKFEESTVGKYSLQSLKNFQEKYIDNKKERIEYPIFNFNFDKIKEYATELSDEQRYKYYLRMEIEIKRVLNAFEFTEFKRFDGNVYFGLKEYIESINYILNKEKCPELNLVVEKRTITLNENSQEKDFKLNIFVIEGDIILETMRITKVRELVNYEIEYLDKILEIKKDNKLDERPKNSTEIKKVDQDTLIEKFQKECIRRNLQKGKTIPNKILYEIAKVIEVNVGTFDAFKSGDKSYHIVREFASRFGYKRKKPTER